ncbi:methyltransferase [Pseudonocardia humida]|uniref:Methyltransferase n=1 Tax=Pseudonocardia humida TaxID=2800819 RepID=A0ABT1A506_9PSEU|nr:methyltransferase [Pseudonocardia humida]MCO1658093.1 methyltransferase [Pseudonocardia humida]
MTTPADALSRLADGYLATQLLHVAVELRLPEALAARPRRAAELADEVGADRAVLHRVLRGLAADGVLDELPDGRFARTPLGELLDAGHPSSMRGAVRARGGLYYTALAGLLAATRTGGTPFELAHGRPFFAHLAAHPEQGAAFQASMVARSRREAAAVVAAYDFSGFGTLVDVGGGPGLLLAAVLAANPALSGTLFDRPEVVAGATLPHVGGDFFTRVPPGADAYLLSRVIHDWDDAEATTILRTCRRAMPDTAVLLLVEALLPERAVDDPAAVRMDLHMLALLHGRERTRREYARLLEGAGLRLERVVPTTGGVHVIEACPAAGG